ncbi:MAG: hypothetical protein NC092_02185 [Butyrivibrio sp.]|nr:hypothetical protein [Muribaculum sp.]MCM1551482.1 hypothetical protein [Butyrivibrio sp.]
MKEPPAYDGHKLWDEILKAIVDTMPEQLFPLFKEVYGKDYPRGTHIALLKTETSTFWENTENSPNSTFMDIALVVDGTDYYHLECQMENDHEMVIRMFAYDVHFAITHAKSVDGNTGEIILRFPHSAVIYPAKNSAIPDHLQCRILFQDNSEHIYQVPTVKIQSYSLEEISEKHLSLFLQYTMLRFRTQKNLEKLTKKELTEYLNEVILILEKEVSAGNLTKLQYRDHLKLIRHAAERVFVEHSELRMEVDKMTARLIRLPSDEYREMKSEYEVKINKQKEEYEVEIAKQKEEHEVEIAKQAAKYEAEIQRLQEQLRLAETN